MDIDYGGGGTLRALAPPLDITTGIYLKSYVFWLERSENLNRRVSERY